MIRILILLLLTTIITACGGGGTSSGNNATDPPITTFNLPPASDNGILLTVSAQGQRHHNGINRFNNLGIAHSDNRFFLVYSVSNTVLRTAKFIPTNTYATHNATTVAGLDKAGIDAHGNTQIVHHYLRQNHQLSSYDGQDSTMVAVTNVNLPLVTRTICGKLTPAGSIHNASWSSVDKIVAFTSLAKGATISFSASLDVVAHEWAHAVDDSYANLAYERESGALSEAFSDWFGVAVEHSTGRGNWLMGEDTELLRSLSSPNDYRDPDTYQGVYWKSTGVAVCDLCNDHCGVHTNSGVANKMFYLLSVGGVHNNVRVAGIGIKTAMKIAMDALQHHWTRNTNFAAARMGMIMAAEPYGTGAVNQVKLAWQAVGVD